MARRVDIVLDEIIFTICEAEKAIVGKSYEQFAGDWLLQRASERALEMISEAVRHLPGHLTALEPDVPWPEIRAIGNRLRHEYHRVQASIIWSSLKDDLPPLLKAVERLRARF